MPDLSLKQTFMQNAKGLVSIERLNELMSDAQKAKLHNNAPSDDRHFNG